MEIIQTEGFELATVSVGDPRSERLAIVTPGRLDTKDYVHNLSHVNYLASLGYYAVTFDPPGTWESPGDISLYNTTNTVRAINDLVYFFGNRPTLLMGHSRGGTASMLAGPTNEAVTHIVAICSGMGVPTRSPDVREGVATLTSRDLPPGKEPTPDDQRRRFELPFEYFTDGDRYDVRPGLEHWSRPKLFFYGVNDVVVPFPVIYNVFERSSGRKAIRALSADHHYRYSPKAIDEVHKALGAFITDKSEV